MHQGLIVSVILFIESQKLCQSRISLSYLESVHMYMSASVHSTLQASLHINTTNKPAIKSTTPISDSPRPSCTFLFPPAVGLTDGAADPDVVGSAPGTNTVLVDKPGSVGAGVDGAPSVTVTTGTSDEVRLGAGSLPGGGGLPVVVRVGAIVTGVLGPRGNISALVNVVGGITWGGGFDVARGEEALGVLGVSEDGGDEL